MKIMLALIVLFISTVAYSAQSTKADDLVLIKGGTFMMGSPASEAWREKDEIQHSVTVSDFYIAKYQVTQKEYQELMGNNP
ncbi:MAG: formylglycine-generating enzyme family protein, partial [Synergistaceae bacterium]|nr:formylglycine-generating enzyme family protein [Synergistaceae bacterium]